MTTVSVVGHEHSASREQTQPLPAIVLVLPTGRARLHPGSAEELGLRLLKAAEYARQRQGVVLVHGGDSRRGNGDCA